MRRDEMGARRNPGARAAVFLVFPPLRRPAGKPQNLAGRLRQTGAARIAAPAFSPRW